MSETPISVQVKTNVDHWLKVLAKWAALALPGAFAFGSKPTDVLCSVIAIAFLAHCVFTRDFSWLRQDWLKLLGLLWVYTVVRAVFAEFPQRGIAEAFAWSRFLLLAASLGTWILVDDAWRHKFMLAVAAVSAFLALDSIFQYVFGVDVFGVPKYYSPDLGVRLTASIGKLYVGATISWIFLPAVLGLYALNYRVASAALAGTCLIATLLSGERMAALVAVAALMLTVPFLRLSRRSLAVMGLVAVVGFGILFALRPQVYDRQVRSMFTMAKNVGTSAYGVIWQRSLRIVAEHPIFGIGMGQFRTECRKPIYGPYDASIERQSLDCIGHPHHIYLEWAVEGGLVALTLFVLGVGALLRRLWRHACATPFNPVFIAAGLTLAIRLFPVSTAPGLMRAWAAIPLWMMMGWAFSFVYTAKSKIFSAPSSAKPT